MKKSEVNETIKEQAAEFYEQQTGLNANRAPQRIKIIEDYLAENKISLSDVMLENHTDYLWNRRNNRTEREKKAKKIGSTNSIYKGYCLSMWWIVPCTEKK